MLGFFEVNDIEKLGDKRGTYMLFIELIRDSSVHKWEMKKGKYVYVGSAKNGLYHRIKRHLSKDKKAHWHIDYLLERAEVKKVFAKLEDCECGTARKLSEKFDAVRGFGSSDCKCGSHLFFMGQSFF